MACMVTNYSESNMPLPAPYESRILAPNASVIIAATKSAVITAFGGASNIPTDMRLKTVPDGQADAVTLASLEAAVGFTAVKTAIGAASSALDIHDQDVTNVDDMDADKLVIGAPAMYVGSGTSFIVIDGSNPPLVNSMRFYDQTTGEIKTVTIAGGAWVIA